MRPPRFWNKTPDQTPAWARALWPLSRLYAWATARRLTHGARHKMPIPVICVGNINMGGTGKTPTTIELVRRLNDMGKNPCVISRGYGGNTAGPVMVDIRKHTADDMGDEPILMAAFAPVCVARDRVLGAKLALQNGADVLVLDDALQNPSLFHDLTITVVDGAVGFGNGRVFPAGPLREPTETGLSRSDLVISIGGMVAIDGPDAVSATLDPLQTGMDWQGLRALAFAGIGRPEKFYKTLRDLGADVVQTRSFGDHQKIPEPLLKRLLTEAQAMNAQLVTTEKDAARLPKAWQQQVITLPVRLNIKQDAKLCALLQGLF